MSTLFVASYIILWILVLALGFSLLALYHHFAQSYLASREGRASQGPPPGTMLKSRHWTDIDGRPVTVPALGEPTVVLFTSTTCKICERLHPLLPSFAAKQGDVVLVVVCAGPPHDVERLALALGPVPVVYDSNYKHAASLAIGSTPFAVAIDRFGSVRKSGLVNDEKGLRWAAHEASQGPRPELVQGGHGE